MKRWIDRNESLPDYGEEVEVSFDGGKTKECNAQFSEHCTCMMAGIAGGHGYFQDEFATIDDNLVLHDVTHWRPKSDLMEELAQRLANQTTPAFEQWAEEQE